MSDPTFFLGMLISVPLLLVGFYGVYLPSCMTAFRHEVITLRREMFLLVAREKLAPDAPAYLYLRGSMNGALANAERLQFTRMVFTYLLFRESLPKIETASLIRRVDDSDTRATLGDIYKRYGSALLRHAIATSPAAWVTFVLLVIVVLGIWVMRGGPARTLEGRIWRKTEPVATVIASQPSVHSDQTVFA